MSATPLLLAAPGLSQEPELVALLGQPGSPLRVARRCVDALDLLAAASEGAVRVAVVSAGLPRLTRDTVARLAASQVSVIGLASDDHPEHGVRLRELDLPVLQIGGDDLADTVAALTRHVIDPRPSHWEYAGGESPTSPAASAPGNGRLVTVWGPAGAPGRTTVAVALADEWARSGIPALLVDADTVGGGALAMHLGVLDEVSGIVVACRQADTGRLDPAGLAGAARGVDRHLRVLTGIANAERWPELRPAALVRLWQACRDTPGVTVVDAGFSIERDEEVVTDIRAPRRAAATLTAVAAADVIVAVGSADPVGMERLVHGLVDLRRAVPQTPVRVVVNRVRRSLLGADGEGQVREALLRHAGVADVTVLPDDRDACDAALRQGGTLAEVAPRSSIRSALRSFARSPHWGEAGAIAA